MKNKTLALLLSSALMLAFASTAVIAQDKPSEKKEACAMKADKACCKEAMVCPVSGDSAKAEIFSEVKGQKVFFCCGDCKTAFDKDPAKYEAKIKKCMEECKKACADSCGKAMGGGKKCGKAGACGKDGEKKCEKAGDCGKEAGKKPEEPAKK
jgi:YHS domain-containing protein